MKKILLLFSLILGAIDMNAGVKIDRIEPSDWYVGMKDASLQLMVYGKNIRMAGVATDYLGVRVDSVVRLQSPNYLLVYLNVGGAKAGEMTLTFTNKGSKAKVKFRLRDREMSGEARKGFTNADVLYMLMPDRFANGNPKNDQLKGMNTYKNDRTQPSLRHGGDLEGLRQHLDYFNKLGVTALWLTPVLENNSPDNNGYSTYHGYGTTDYYKVDPRFGGPPSWFESSYGYDIQPLRLRTSVGTRHSLGRLVQYIRMDGSAERTDRRQACGRTRGFFRSGSVEISTNFV